MIKVLAILIILCFLVSCTTSKLKTINHEKQYWQYGNTKVDNRLDSLDVQNIFENMKSELKKDIVQIEHPDEFENKYLKRATGEDLKKIIVATVDYKVQGYNFSTYVYIFRRDNYEWMLEEKREKYQGWICPMDVYILTEEHLEVQNKLIESKQEQRIELFSE